MKNLKIREKSKKLELVKVRLFYIKIKKEIINY